MNSEKIQNACVLTVARVALSVVLTCALTATGLPATSAWADSATGADAVNASADNKATADTSATGASPCVLSDEARAQYEADGTLEERIAYMEWLQSGSTGSGLIAAAKQRAGEAGTAGEAGATDGTDDADVTNDANSAGVLSAAETNVPTDKPSGMGTTGNAYILSVAVEFPAEGDEAAYTFDNAHTQAQNMTAAIQGNTGFNKPYENLCAYYQRSSYGKLTIGNRGITYVVQAQHSRDFYTAGRDLLFYEVATTLDEQYNVDFTQYDGNNDGYVDGMYIVFAGQDTGWGSTWWPSQYAMNGGSRTYDGMQLRNTVLIDAMGSEDKVSTLIHETGHVLGLEDYYSYENRTSGLNTVDMMNNSAGDHNAFSKWLLGWIDDSQITRVAVTENGIKVRRGTGNVQTFEKSTTQDISAFTSNTLTEGGNFIAVSNDESILSGPLFSSFYLLQYDQVAGNQDYYFYGKKLVPGLRVYRVQAGLDITGYHFAKSNGYATAQHDLLIESVRPSDGEAAYELGDAFHTGAEIGTYTTPSTNFHEDYSGYTGIHVKVASADNAENGSVMFTCDEQPPEVPFTITPTSSAGILDNDVREFTLSKTVDQSLGITGVQLVVDGQTYYPYAHLTGCTLRVSFNLPEGTIKQNSTCEMVFPEGMFTTFGTSLPEVRVSLSPRVPLVETNEHGTYENSTYSSYGTSSLLSNVVSVGGKKIAVQAQPAGMTDFSLRLLTFSEDGSSVETCAVDGVKIENAGLYYVQAFATNDGNVIAHVYGYTLGQSKKFEMLYWIDSTTGEVTKSRDLTSLNMSNAPIVMPLGNGAAVTANTATVGDGKLVIWARSANEYADIYVTMHATNFYASGDGRVVTANYNVDSPGQVSIYSADQIKQISVGATYEDVVPDISLQVPTSDSIEDVKVNGSYVYVLTRTTTNGASTLAVHTFDLDGTLQDTVTIKGSSATGETKSSLVFGENGAFTITTSSVSTSVLSSNAKEIAVVESDGTFAGYCSSTRGDQVFFADECLYVLSQNVDSASNTGLVNWRRTAAVDSEQVDPLPPDGGADGSGDDSGEGAGGDANNGYMPQAGDSTGSVVLLCVCALLSSCVLIRRVVVRSEREHK